jgi:hypothetical protein
MPERPLSGIRIGLFGKGGSGKSTVTVFLAESLRRLGYSVVILDADSTNVGLAKALGIPRELLPLLEYFGGMVFSGGRVTAAVRCRQLHLHRGIGFGAGSQQASGSEAQRAPLRLLLGGGLDLYVLTISLGG